MKPEDIVVAGEEITRLNLEYHYELNKETLDDFYEGKRWLHRDDVEHVSYIMHCLREVIEYYGGAC